MTETTRQKRQYVDFSSVPPSQWKMHDRLENWARSNRGGDKQTGASSPTFALYRSTDAKREYGAETAVPVDRMDAMRVSKGVMALPHNHRAAIHWLYVHGGRNPWGQVRALGVTKAALAELVQDSRQMLINRGV